MVLRCFRCFAGSESKSFRPPSEAEVLLFCLSKREVPKRKRHPAWRLPPILGRQVRELGPGFSTGLLSGRKGVDIPVDSPAGLSSPPHRRTGAPGRAARHPGAHSVRHRVVVAKAEEPKSRRAEEPKSRRAEEPKSRRAEEPKSRRAEEPKSKLPVGAHRGQAFRKPVN
jgi:hypothetical protein